MPTYLITICSIIMKGLLSYQVASWTEDVNVSDLPILAVLDKIFFEFLDTENSRYGERTFDMHDYVWDLKAFFFSHFFFVGIQCVLLRGSFLRLLCSHFPCVINFVFSCT